MWALLSPLLPAETAAVGTFSVQHRAPALSITTTDGAQAGLGTSWCQEGWLGFAELREESLVGKRETWRWRVWHYQGLQCSYSFPNQLWEGVHVLLGVRALRVSAAGDPGQGVPGEVNLPCSSPQLCCGFLWQGDGVSEVSSGGCFLCTT